MFRTKRTAATVYRGGHPNPSATCAAAHWGHLTMTRINTNVSSLVAQNRLQASNKDLQTRLTRLSTGLRIN
ncbi:MAG: hypothetical protein AAF989_10565, partial [Planctomycetota bacterium]